MTEAAKKYAEEMAKLRQDLPDDEWDAIADPMDALWWEMTPEERAAYSVPSRGYAMSIEVGP